MRFLLLILCAGPPALQAGDLLDPSAPFEAPVVAGPPTTAQAAGGLTGRPTNVTTNNQTIRSTNDRWRQRSQRMRAAALRAAAQQQNNAWARPQPVATPPGTAQPRRLSARVLQAVPTAFQAPAGRAPGATGPDAYSTPAVGPRAITKPSELRKITQILPFTDYEPDPEIAKTDPCRNLCPRPGGAPCRAADGKAPECPREIALSEGVFQPRSYGPSLYAWEASNVYHNPLYFQDSQLERYGHTWPFLIQPIASVARFSIQAIGLPYQMTIDPPCSRVYPLGYYRPGEYSPKQIQQIPWNTHAALVEAGAVTGVYFLFPHSAWFP